MATYKGPPGITSKNPYIHIRPSPLYQEIQPKGTVAKPLLNSGRNNTSSPSSSAAGTTPLLGKLQFGPNMGKDYYYFTSPQSQKTWLNANFSPTSKTTPAELKYYTQVQELLKESENRNKLDGIQQRALDQKIQSLPQNYKVLFSLIKDSPIQDYSDSAKQYLQKGIDFIPKAEINKTAQLDAEKLSYDKLIKSGESLRPQSPASTVPGVATPVVVKALAPEQKVGGTKTAITNPTGTFFVESTQNGPKISVATQTAGTRTSDNATNITPIVNYKTAPEGSPAIINTLLVDTAKKFQEMLTGQLVGNIYNETATQTTRPEYSLDEKGITAIAPLNPVTDAQIKEKAAKDIEEQKFNNQKFVDEEKRQTELKLEAQEKEKQKEIDKQKAINDKIEADNRFLEKAAADARLRSQNQFDYDSAIEAALRAAAGNSSLARKQFAANDARQKALDAEELAKRNAIKGNPTGYAGGFAEKAIQKTPNAPAAIKAPAMAQPQTPEPIEPANKVASSFLPPKVDGLQFGGT
jgi:hypothetical protein